MTEIAMARPKPQPLSSDPADYDGDFHAWAFEQADLLHLGRFGEADLANIVEELRALGRSERRALVSSYRLVLVHLLKWLHQPERRTRSWELTLRRERRSIAKAERESPSLRAMAATLLAEAYEDARHDAADETGLPLATFPTHCPWPVEAVRDMTVLPDPAVPDAPPAPSRAPDLDP